MGDFSEQSSHAFRRSSGLTETLDDIINPFSWAKNSVGYLPYTENSRAIKVKDLTALHIVRSAGIRDGDKNSKISLMIGIFL